MKNNKSKVSQNAAGILHSVLQYIDYISFIIYDVGGKRLVSVYQQLILGNNGSHEQLNITHRFVN
jgi:hypothetical protein